MLISVCFIHINSIDLFVKYILVLMQLFVHTFPRMNKTSANQDLTFAAAERDVGIRSATLRLWERPHGLPNPVRDEGGDRVYPEDQLERPRRVRRLINHGHRLDKIVRFSPGKLRQLPFGFIKGTKP